MPGLIAYQIHALDDGWSAAQTFLDELTFSEMTSADFDALRAGISNIVERFYLAIDERDEALRVIEDTRVTVDGVKEHVADILYSVSCAHERASDALTAATKSIHEALDDIAPEEANNTDASRGGPLATAAPA